MIGTIKGDPTPAANVVLASSDLVNPNLTDLVDTILLINVTLITLVAVYRCLIIFW